MNKFIRHFLSKDDRIETLESKIEELEDRIYTMESAASRWAGLVHESIFESRRQIQDAIVRAFSSEQMMDWLKNAVQTAAVPNFTSLIQLAYPALKDMKPGPMNWANEEDESLAVTTVVTAPALSADSSGEAAHTA